MIKKILSCNFIILFFVVLLAACGESAFDESSTKADSSAKESNRLPVATGSIEAAVEVDLVPDPSCIPEIYIFKGDVEPHDIRENMSNLVAVAEAVSESDSPYFEYSIGLLEAGVYTAAPTCQASEDDPIEEDPIFFFGKMVIEVRQGEAALADFIKRRDAE